jgi:pimeloyl-ACP methyl ester carboxylesterase
MQTIEGFDFFPLTFGRDGKPTGTAELATLIAHLTTVGATDAVLIAHGFRNSEAEAQALYTNFLKTFRANAQRAEVAASIGTRRIVVGGVFWPSKAFREVGDADEGSVQGLGDETALRDRVRERLVELRDQEARPDQRPKIDRALVLLPGLQNNRDAQDEFVDLVLSLLDRTHLDATEGLDQIRAQSGADLLDKLALPIILPTVRGDDDGGVAAVGSQAAGDGAVLGIGDVFSSITGRVGQLLNMTTWYLMKDRSGTVGAVGVADAVRKIKASRPALKIHLVGHSLGGRLVAAAAKALGTPPPVRLDSLTLLEAAFSHYGFSANNGFGAAGFFREVVAGQVVRGPLISTFSFEDTVVGKAYAIASRLAGDNTKAVGDANDPFGGIGRNGTQRTTEAVSDVLHAPGTPYNFPLNVVNNLDGSGGLIKNHGDVTNAAVTYAFASALART